MHISLTNQGMGQCCIHSFDNHLDAYL